jgi:hypothetical protein
LKSILISKYDRAFPIQARVRHEFGLDAKVSLHLWKTKEAQVDFRNSQDPIEALKTDSYIYVDVQKLATASNSSKLEKSSATASSGSPSTGPSAGTKVAKAASDVSARAASFSPVEMACAFPAAPGVVGLTNIGNTCYLNSALQCLAQTYPFVSYFLSYRYLADVNRSPRSSYKGKLSAAFAKVLHDIWLPKSASPQSPFTLKNVLGKKNDAFRGYNQQDVADLLTALLDNLVSFFC